jgi:hypothetical protein
MPAILSAGAGSPTARVDTQVSPVGGTRQDDHDHRRRRR